MASRKFPIYKLLIFNMHVFSSKLEYNLSDITSRKFKLECNLFDMARRKFPIYKLLISNIQGGSVANFRLVFQVNFVPLKEINLPDITEISNLYIYILEISDLFCACILVRIRVQFV